MSCCIKCREHVIIFVSLLVIYRLTEHFVILEILFRQQTQHCIDYFYSKTHLLRLPKYKNIHFILGQCHLQ